MEDKLGKGGDGPCVGTEDDVWLWCNVNPRLESYINVTGTYVLILYANVAVVYYCAVAREWWYYNCPCFLALSGLLIWAHLKTMMTDPGAVPRDAIACSDDKVSLKAISDGFCSKCDRFKPAKAYHCSKCRRCISRMDHHCPYTNNCVGAKNQKHMILFLIYCNIVASYALGLVAYYGLGRGFLYERGWTTTGLLALLGVDGCLTLVFTGAMTRRQIIALKTGIGTIDRLKLAKRKPIAGGAPVPLTSVFGHTRLLWPLPIDPDFPPAVEQELLGFRTPRSPPIAYATASNDSINSRDRTRAKTLNVVADRRPVTEPLFSPEPDQETPLFCRAEDEVFCSDTNPVDDRPPR